jgi:UDP-glucose 4-epimerase
MRYLVTGGAGFVGHHLVGKLLAEGHEVIVYDNLSLGKREHVAPFLGNPHFTFIQDDVLDAGSLTEAMKGAEVVWHLAANSDIRAGVKDPTVERDQGILATFNVLQAMRDQSVGEIVFTSSSVIYGDAEGNDLREDFGPLRPISYYGASKLAAEGLVSGFCHMCDMKGWIFRFANIVGKGLTHGVLFDFIGKLRGDPTRLEILGDGHQAKPYLHVSECVDGMLWGLRHAEERVNIFNLAPCDSLCVKEIAQIVVEEMGLKDVSFHFAGGRGGWKGDVPRVRLSGDALARLGWQPKMNSEEAVRMAVREVLSETKQSPQVDSR